MNPWQAVKQMVTTLRAAVWPDLDGQGASVKVLGDASVTTLAAWLANAGSLRLPSGLLLEADSQDDAEAPERGISRFELHLVAEVDQDQLGETSFTGGSRDLGVGSSSGRGVTEIEEAVRSALAGLDASLRLNLRPTRAQSFDLPVEDRMLAHRALTFEATTTRDRFYHPVRSLVLGNAGGNAVSVAYKDPPARWDTLGSGTPLRFVYKAGGTPPANPTDGTTLDKALGASPFNVATGAGTWSFAAFCQYDENGDAVADRWSVAATGTIAGI